MGRFGNICRPSTPTLSAGFALDSCIAVGLRRTRERIGTCPSTGYGFTSVGSSSCHVWTDPNPPHAVLKRAGQGMLAPGSLKSFSCFGIVAPPAYRGPNRVQPRRGDIKQFSLCKISGPEPDTLCNPEGGGATSNNSALKLITGIVHMLKIGLDIGTGFVKCMSDYGPVRFPSIYAKRIHGSWTDTTTEAVGAKAQSMLDTMGTTAIAPIYRGKPDSRYQKQVELLIKEAVRQVRVLAKAPADSDDKIRIVVGLPYHAFKYRESISKTVRKALNAEKCTVVAQASGTLVDLGRDSGIVVSIGQGTTEIVVIDGFEVIDGDSSRWASDFVTKKIGRFAHLDPDILNRNQDICKKYSKILAENLIREICDMADNYGRRYPLAVSGGGLLLPGMRDEITAGLKEFKLQIPTDPVMSNARGLYSLAE